jgi:uncharacterized protein (TIGR02246 family)
MRIVSWIVVLVSVGWLLAYNLDVSFNVPLPEVSVGQVSGTVSGHDEKSRPSDLHDFATRYTEAWNSHDPARVASFYAPQGRITINRGDPYVGDDGLTEMADGFLTEFPDLNLKMEGLERRDDRVVYHWSFTGTHAETGNHVRISGSETWRFGDDGLIAESVGRYDPEEYERQVRGASH